MTLLDGPKQYISPNRIWSSVVKYWCPEVAATGSAFKAGMLDLTQYVFALCKNPACIEPELCVCLTLHPRCVLQRTCPNKILKFIVMCNWYLACMQLGFVVLCYCPPLIASWIASSTGCIITLVVSFACGVHHTWLWSYTLPDRSCNFQRTSSCDWGKLHVIEVFQRRKCI